MKNPTPAELEELLPVNWVVTQHTVVVITEVTAIPA